MLWMEVLSMKTLEGCGLRIDPVHLTCATQPGVSHTSPIHVGKTLEGCGTDRPCTLDMYNTTRSFAHESNTCVIRRWAFLIFGFIVPLSCIPPPTTLLSTIFGWGAGSWHSPRTQDVVKCKKTSHRFGALQFVCAHRRACATIPRLTLFCTIPNCSAHFRQF